ncbi:MAG: CoA pyrophosphatase [Dehalococcoidia bacterium]|nr:CoA pyrophosphatase [Dehalococcoidia bacterium]
MIHPASVSHLLAVRRRRTIAPQGRPRAAVLLALYGPDADPRLLYTVRSFQVEHHKGEISFPGGAIDPGDTTVEDAALREAFEEIGLAQQDVSVLGQLDDIVTISNFVVTPVVGRLARHPYDFTLHTREVARLLEVPLSHLLDPASVQSQALGPEKRIFPRFTFGADVIWGATARITHDFLDMLRQQLAPAVIPATAPAHDHSNR